MTLTIEDLHWLTTARAAEPELAADVAGARVAQPHRPGLEIVGSGTHVPLATGGEIEYANLDHAASAPALRVVAEAVDKAVQHYASVHRGAGFHSQLSTALYEGARQPVREFVGARDSDAVIFTRNTTDAFNLLAHCLPVGTTVVVFETEHHATLLPWEQYRVIRLPAPASPEAAVRAVADTCRDQRRNGPVLVVVTGASNVTGEIWPVARLAAAAHAHGARIALDAAQLAPHRPFSIADLWVDYVAISGHKVYAPYGAGALIGRPDWLAAATPYLIGGGATATVTDTHTEWKPLPDRHEAGTPNVPGVVALATACHALLTADREGLVDVERVLTARLIGGLQSIPGVTVHSLFDGATGVIGVATFTVHGVPSNIVAAALSAEHGIGVRDGAFCAQPLVRRLLGSAGCGSVDGTGHAVRASVGLGTTSEHVDRLVGAVREIADRGPALRYIDVDGRPQPLHDQRVLPTLVPWQV